MHGEALNLGLILSRGIVGKITAEVGRVDDQNRELVALLQKLTAENEKLVSDNEALNKIESSRAKAERRVAARRTKQHGWGLTASSWTAAKGF
jgi:hypothetical protein